MTNYCCRCPDCKADKGNSPCLSLQYNEDLFAKINRLCGMIVNSRSGIYPDELESLAFMISHHPDVIGK